LFSSAFFANGSVIWWINVQALAIAAWSRAEINKFQYTFQVASEFVEKNEHSDKKYHFWQLRINARKRHMRM
jgi:hypothetical protein